MKRVIFLFCPIFCCYLGDLEVLFLVCITMLNLHLSLFLSHTPTQLNTRCGSTPKKEEEKKVTSQKQTMAG